MYRYTSDKGPFYLKAWGFDHFTEDKLGQVTECFTSHIVVQAISQPLLTFPLEVR